MSIITKLRSSPAPWMGSFFHRRNTVL